MPILVMGLMALGVFGLIGIMLFWAETAEHRKVKHDATERKATTAEKHA